MTRRVVFAFTLTSLALSACVGTPAAYEPKAVKADAHHDGYLDDASLEALASRVPSPPASASPEEASDRALSATYKTFENTDRWLLATSHAEVRIPFALQHFDCALGVRFDPANNPAPATARLMQRLFEDAEAASTLVKLRAYRARPVGDDPQRLACQTVSSAGRATPSYPSGSATVAAAYGAAMAVIDPAHAQDARNIGHQIAFSRAICGMHYPADVKAGIALGQAVFDQAALSPTFAADLAQARTEVSALQARQQTNPGCIAERQALSMTSEPL